MRHLTKISILMAMMSIAIFSCGDNDEEKREYDYHFTPPPSWTIGINSADDMAVYEGPADSDFNPQISVCTNNSGLTLDEFVDGFINGWSTDNYYALVSRTDFKTNGGLSGTKAVFLYRLYSNDDDLRFVVYILPPKSGSKTYAAIICIGLSEWGTKYDTMFETSAKSFAWK